MAEWYRSWPSWFDSEELYFGAPEHLRERPFVWDNLPRIRMKDWDYFQAEWWPEGIDLLLLEWDIALDRQGRERFEAFCRQHTERVAVAQYHLSDGRFITGNGCIYLPWSVVREWQDEGRDHEINPSCMWSDSSFFDWYGYRKVRVCDYVYPQHLNS